MEFLLSIIVSVVALFIPIVLYFKQRNRKGIAYKVISVAPVLSLKENEIKGKVKLLIGEKLVSDAHRVLLRIWNNGNATIYPYEYMKPITLVFGKDTEILSAEVLETTPTGIEASVKSNTGNVILEPLLLNGKDSILLSVLLTQFNGDINVSARIAGVKQVSKSNTYLF